MTVQMMLMRLAAITQLRWFLLNAAQALFGAGRVWILGGALRGRSWRICLMDADNQTWRPI